MGNDTGIWQSSKPGLYETSVKVKCPTQPKLGVINPFSDRVNYLDCLVMREQQNEEEQEIANLAIVTHLRSRSKQYLGHIGPAH